MTKGEIKGLRQLAMAQGGDLTINPETGLYEAGFLSRILPIVAAGAATYFTAGAAAPALSAALSGTALAGAGGILAGAGAGALIGGISSGIQGGDVGKGALFGGLGGAISGGLGAYDASPVAGGLGGEGIVAEGANAGAALNPDFNAGLAGTTQTVPTPGFTPAEMAMGSGNPITSGYAPTSGLTPAEMAAGSFRSGVPTMTDTTSGFGASGVTPAQSAEAMKTLGSSGVSYGGQAAPSYYSGLGSGMGDMATKAAILAAPGIGAQMGADTYDENGVPTGQSSSVLDRISPNFRAQEPVQPNPYYSAGYPDYKKNPYGMAGGGAVAFANRGIVQDLPRSSGMDVGTYSDSDPNTRNLDAYNAALYNIKKRASKAGMGKNAIALKEAKQLGDVEEAAAGGLMNTYQSGGPVERMSQMNTALNPQGGLYPQGMVDKTQYAVPTQRPTSMEVLDAGAQRTFASGGITSLGGYSDGGRMLKGPGDGMSDSIPAVIGSKQPARLADGEFVVPADVVSHLGNGSTDAGAKRLYSMMDKIRKARTGKKKQAPQVKTHKFLPA
jgi:hypothetical protein